METLVALALVAILAAVTVPILTTQIRQYDATRVARDLASIRAAVEAFSANVGVQPRYLTHLTGPVDGADSTVARVPYSTAQTAAWTAPYLNRTLADSLREVTAFATGFNGSVQNDLVCFRPSTNAVAPCGTGTHIAVRIDGLIGSQFEAINDRVDGTAEVDGRGLTRSRGLGKLRFTNDFGIDLSLSPGITYYLAAPYLRR